MYPLRQGFYIRAGDGWVAAWAVPCDHLTGRNWRFAVLRRDVLYVDKHANPHVATIGFPFNGLSIPRLLWRVAGHPWGRYLLAGVIHDALCAIAMSLPPGEIRDQVRLHADELFEEMLTFLGASSFVARTWFECVRTGSWWSRRSRQIPDYRTDLGGYYASLGIEGITHIIMDRRSRHREAASTGWMR